MPNKGPPPKNSMSMFHISDNLWNNSWSSAAHFFVAQTDHQSCGISLYGEKPLNRTTTQVNQLKGRMAPIKR